MGGLLLGGWGEMPVEGCWIVRYSAYLCRSKKWNVFQLENYKTKEHGTKNERKENEDGCI
jgi:hypothetical protein